MPLPLVPDFRHLHHGLAHPAMLRPTNYPLLLLGMTACAAPTPVSTHPGAPQHAKRVEARSGVVSTPSIEASSAGLEMLRRGGNAVDAAVAAAFALAVVDPSQTGIGGYASAVIWMRGARRAEVVEGHTESGADPAWGTTSRDTGEVRQRGRLALVPGFVAGLLLMHERHGVLPRDAVMAPAVRLAGDGFLVGPMLHRHLVNARDLLTSDPEAASVFYPHGEAILPGERLVQPRLAAMLDAIARDGGRAFYEGENPRLIADRVRAAGGWLDSADFAQYRANLARPVCGTFLGLTVLGGAAPMAAHTAIESLQLIELSGAHRLGNPTADSASATRLADAVRIGLADRRAARAGRDGSPASVRGVASLAFAESRLPYVGRTVSDTLVPVDPREFEGAALTSPCVRHDPYPAAAVGASARDGARDVADDFSLTSHISVIDRDRNAVTMTSSIGVLWGSGVYVNGMWLNSSANLFAADERGPRRRPGSLTMPLLALEGDDVRLAMGAAGGGYIAAAVVQTTFRILALQQEPYTALAAPRFQVNPTSRRLEAEPGFAIPVYAGWRAHGYMPSSRVADLTFGAVHTVMQRRDGLLVGAADPRRDGAALGY